MGKLAFRLALLASALCLLAGVVALYAGSAIVDRDEFADRAVAALAQDEVTDEIATRFTDATLERSPGLVTLRPALHAAAERICFASMADARLAAEGASVPQGAVVQELDDGRVCVRGR